VPPQDQGTLLVRLQTPVGSSIDFTNEVFKQAEAYVSSRGEIRRYYAAIGGFGGGEVNTGIMFPGQSFSAVFTEPGTYRYVCSIHPGMYGTIVVTE